MLDFRQVCRQTNSQAHGRVNIGDPNSVTTPGGALRKRDGEAITCGTQTNLTTDSTRTAVGVATQNLRDDICYIPTCITKFMHSPCITKHMTGATFRKSHTQVVWEAPASISARTDSCCATAAASFSATSAALTSCSEHRACARHHKLLLTNLSSC